MCGIVAALPVYDSTGEDPGLSAVVASLPEAPWPAREITSPDVAEKALGGLIERLDVLGADLARVPVAAALVMDGAARSALRSSLRTLSDWSDELDAHLDTAGWDADVAQGLQAVLRLLADRTYSVLNDRVEAADRAAALAVSVTAPHVATSLLAVETVLGALDRLEVRGRDSAGVTISVELSDDDRAAVGALGRNDVLFRSGSVTQTEAGACFVYKRAAVIGRLGDNVAALRASIHHDTALQSVIARPSARVTVLAHTRWASVGRISEANAHPVDSRWPDGGAPGPYAVAALNGDIDNYVALQAELGYEPEELGISTDAKLIPVLLARNAAAGVAPGPAMVESLAAFHGSMAIGAQFAARSDGGSLLLGVKGSGQGLFVGLASSGFLVASEVYGLIAGTSEYLRLDGDFVGGADRRGTVISLNRDGAGTLAGLERWNGDGKLCPVDEEQEIRTAEVTSRDLALGTNEHYLQKEIHEAPGSFRKTLRGRVQRGPEGLEVQLPESSLPASVRERLRSGAFREILVIGQGTAAVASQGIADLIKGLVGERLNVAALPATEFSAWRLRPRMADTLIIAVSQSGTTTDTNRAVDLARLRGAASLAIVNRRDSDLATKSDGVTYTSDGRDVEMAVASTKAFYAQVAAGCLLGIEIARDLGVLAPGREANLLEALQEVPDRLLALRDLESRLVEVAAQVVTRYPYWTVLGSGPSRVAAAEIRIKLSELCYKTISTDAVEDKKHIDLSAEALVLVCVAGAPLNQLSDLVKEVEIFAAHGNRPVVICDAGTEDMWPTPDVIGIPAGHRDLAWIITTATGHLFAYHAAKAIDAAADLPRLALARLEESLDAGRDPATELPANVIAPMSEFLGRAVGGDLRGVLTSPTALMVANVLLTPRRAAAQFLTSDGASGGASGGTSGGESTTVARAALTAAIDELARSIDTVKHQAKTVTVGTSRDDADLYDNEFVSALEQAGADRQHLTLASLRVMRSHAGVVESVNGVTRYRIDRSGPDPAVSVLRKTGVAEGLTSRADTRAGLVGSKRRVADLGQPRLVRGRFDHRVVLIVPEQTDRGVDALSVVHVTLRAAPGLEALSQAMRSVGDRLAEIEAAVTETAPSFSPERLLDIPVEDALLAPVDVVAERLAAAR